MARLHRRSSTIHAPRVFRRVLPWGFLPVFAVACHDPTAPERPVHVRGTVGEEVFGIVCDRVGGQALREDLDGSSFHAACHKDVAGRFADDVDESKLPPIDDRVRGAAGEALDLEAVRQRRIKNLARVRALLERRADLIGALDAIFPDVRIAIRDIRNPDPTKTCGELGAERAGDEADLSEQLANMLGRIQALYNDGTIPRVTQATARLMKNLDASVEGRDALARVNVRRGYKPADFGLSMLRPTVAYPNLRDLANGTLAAISVDSDPYGPTPAFDTSGNRIPVRGAANPQFVKLLEVAHEELRTMTIDPKDEPLRIIDEPATGRHHPSRPRTTLEFATALNFAEDDVFRIDATGPLYGIRRDPFGFAQVATGTILPNPAPSPFPAADGVPAPAYDAFGRALDAPGGKPLFDTIDVHRTLLNALLANLRPLIKVDPQNPDDALLDFLAGVEPLLGSRDLGDTSKKAYPPVDVAYNQFHPENAPLLDFLSAVSNVLAYSHTEETLSLLRLLVTEHQPDVARLIGEFLRLKSVADKFPNAALPAQSTFWDELLDVVVQIAKEPGMLEDTLRALGDDRTVELSEVFANYTRYKDLISYDRQNLNGPIFNLTTNQANVAPKTAVDWNQADVGDNRSGLQRFLQLVSDTNGVTACNKEGATLYAVVTSPATAGVLFPEDYAMGNPATGYKACELLKVENLAKFYLESIVQKSKIYVRQDHVRNGTPDSFFLLPKNTNPATQKEGDYCGFDVAPGLLQCTKIGNLLNITSQANEALFEQVTGIRGFWTTDKTFAVKPEFLSRFAFFDFDKDTTNLVTKTALTRINGLQIGSRVCREKVFPDPCAAGSTSLHNATCQSANAVPGEVAPDKMIHGYYECDEGSWLRQRDDNTLYLGEVFGFQEKTKPLLNVFVNHNKTQLFIDLLSTLHRHYQGGIAKYEPITTDLFLGDTLRALHDLEKTLEPIKVKRCKTWDAAAKRCSEGEDVPAIDALADVTRDLLDPDRAKAIGLKNRDGTLTGRRNDGKTNPQTTPIYQITSALSAFDDAFAKQEQAQPDDVRRTPWRHARSRMVDQFLAIQGTKQASTFANPMTPKVLPIVLDLLRDQLVARCPGSFAPPYPRCEWAQSGMVKNMADTTGGPLFAGLIDLLEALRKLPSARYETERLLAYFLDPASPNAARSATLLATVDFLQLLRDQDNLVPIGHALVEATGASRYDQNGKLIEQSVLDAASSLLARLSGKARDTAGTEICSRELDPNQVLTFVLQKLVSSPPAVRAPLDVIIDVIMDVNREDPTLGDAKLESADYASVARNLTDFFLDKERGLEQFYEVIRQGTQGNREP